MRQSSVCPARSIGWVPTMCRLPLEGTVARRTSSARGATRSAGSVSRGALCRAGLSPSSALAVPFTQGLPLSSGFVNDKIQTL